MCNSCNSLNNNFISNNYINMSDPLNYDDNASTNQSNTNTPSKSKDPTILSYFTEQDAKKELKAEWAEMVLVFATSVGISLYFNDSIFVAVERGGILAVAQYVGGFLSDALNNAKYYQSGGKYKKYVPLLSKFVMSTGIFVAGNVALLGTKQPYHTLFGESAVASVIAHYGSPYVKKIGKKVKPTPINDNNNSNTSNAY